MIRFFFIAVSFLETLAAGVHLELRALAGSFPDDLGHPFEGQMSRSRRVRVPESASDGDSRAGSA